MTAILVPASTFGFVDCGAGGSGSPSGSVTVPTGCTRLMVAPMIHSAALRTISAMTFNGVSMAQVSGTRGTNTTNGGDSCEWWTLANPAIGAKTLAATLSASGRGGLMAVFLMGDTGLGAVGAAGEAAIQLSGVLDGSLVLAAAMLEDDSTVVGVGAFGNSFMTQKLSDGAGGGSVIGMIWTQRGYPRNPSAQYNPATGAGGVGAGSAVEVLS